MPVVFCSNKEAILGIIIHTKPQSFSYLAESMVSKKRAPAECSEAFILAVFPPSRLWTICFTSQAVFHPSPGLLSGHLIPHTMNAVTPSMSSVDLESEVLSFIPFPPPICAHLGLPAASKDVHFFNCTWRSESSSPALPGLIMVLW